MEQSLVKELCIKSIVIFIALLICLHQAWSQPHHSTDSLLTEISQAENDTVVLELYQQLIRNNWYYDMELSKFCTDTSLQIAKAMNNKYYIANSSHNYGLYHRFQGNSDSAFYYFNQALELFGPINDSTKMTGTLFNLAVMYSIQGSNELALSYFIDYKKIHEKEGNKRWVCEADNSIGLVFLDMKEFEKSEKYLKNSLQCATELNNDYSRSLALGNLQSLYVTWDKYEESIEYGRQALQIEKELQNSGGIGLISSNLSLAFQNINELDSATLYAELGISALEKHGEAIHLSESYTNMGNLLNAKNLPTKAIIFFKKSKKLNEEGTFNQVSLKTINGLSYAHELLGDFKSSLRYKKEYVTTSERLFDAEKIEIQTDLEVKYETSQKELKLKTQQLEIQKQTTQKSIFTTSSILLLLIASGTFLFMRNKLNFNNKLAVQKAAFQQQKIDQLQKEKKIINMSSMIEGQESERKRIAQDLHDGLGGLLATIKVKFGVIQKEITELNSMNVYQQTNTMIDDACTEVRKIAHNMMPDSLSKLGLVESICDIAEYTTDIKIKLVNLGIHSLSETQEIMLYRIVQEFLNNTRKHANASQVIVQFSKNKTHTIIYMEDDGQGFDMTDSDSKKGLGIKSIESRINFLNATYQFESTMGIGTSLEIEIPI